MLAWALTIGCAGRSSSGPDYSAWLRVGVDPIAEADAVLSALERAGYRRSRRLEAPAWSAFEARRGPLRAIRVITARGVALALDSHEPDGLVPRHGAISLVEPSSAGAHDVDRDGADEIVIGAEIEGRTCLLPFRVDAEGAVSPRAPDLRSLGPDVCIEALRDVDGRGDVEAVVVLRAPSLRRAAMPSVEVPLEFDLEGIARVGTTPVGHLESERARAAEALRVALEAPDPESIYVLAIEAALRARGAGAAVVEQVEAFDRTLARAVIPRAMVADIVRARATVEGGWVTPPTLPAP